MSGLMIPFNEVIQTTKKLLGDNGIDYSYITPEMVKRDAALGSESILKSESTIQTYYEGNNARYGAQDINGTTYQGYIFDYAANDPCGNTNSWFVTIDWHHQYIGRCANGREKWGFTSG